MKTAVFSGLLSLALLSAPAMAEECTPEVTMKKGAELASTLQRVANGDADMLKRINERLVELQTTDPTRSGHSACEAYERLIREIEKLESDSGK